jgi:GNAT superfamily N-acetyltransferase
MDDDYEARLAEFDSWVDEGDGTIRGVILLEESGGRLWVDNISVDPDHQGAGIGKSLLELSLTRGAERGFEEVHLFTHELMDADRAIYEHLGWIEYEEEAPLADFFVYFRKPTNA